MKYGLIVVLLTSVCSTMPCAYPVVTAPEYQRLINQYLILYGMFRANMDTPVRLQPAIPVPAHQQQRPQLQAVMQPVYKKQKKQKQQYYNNKNNNRADRQKHAQSNMRIHQPKQRGQKK